MPPSNSSLEPWLHPLWHRKLAQDIDAIAATDLHLEPAVLMETAGRFLGQICYEEWSEQTPDCQVLILCGAGNNGGDGLVAARYLAELGVPIHVVITAPDEHNLSRLCRRQLATLLALEHEVEYYKPGLLEKNFRDMPLITIDAVMGIGFTPPARREDLAFQALGEAAKLDNQKVIACDLPSGLAADHFGGTEVPLAADHTLTFGNLKPVHVVAPGNTFCGEVMTVDIGFPHKAFGLACSGEPLQLLYCDQETLAVEDPWQALPADAHKYDRGHVLVLGGSPGKTGAPLMTALGALRAGAGWASVALGAACDRPRPLDITEETFFSDGKIDQAELLLFLQQRQVKSLVIGPGTMANPITQELLEGLCEWDGFVVIDAGALQDVCELMARLRQAPPAGKWLTTPHPGEWRKMGFIQKELNNLEDLAKAHQEARTLGLAVLYKSSTPILFGAGVDLPIVTDAGGNQLAKAGTGDILCGLIAAHGALRPEPCFAAMRGYGELARISALVADGIGQHNVIASDLL